MTHDQEPEIVEVWHTASAIGQHFEELLADGNVLPRRGRPGRQTHL
jgi:hypothetical protein